jgi:Probable transposase
MPRFSPSGPGIRGSSPGRAGSPRRTPGPGSGGVTAAGSWRRWHCRWRSPGPGRHRPRHLARRARNLARYQRRTARCQPGSANRAKAKAKAARAHRKVRADFLHQASTSLVRDHDVIVLEDLAVQNMVRNRRLAKAIADCRWGAGFEPWKGGQGLQVTDFSVDS